MRISVLIVAAGKGLRAGGGDIPKQYQHIAGQAVLAHTINAFSQVEQIDHIVCAINPDHEILYSNTVKNCPSDKLGDWVKGGQSRQQTVANGLKQLAQTNPTHVLIHDGARPFISRPLIERILAALENNAVVLPALPVTDTLKYVKDNVVSHTIDRAPLWAAQTPQSFAFKLALELHRLADAETKQSFTDDISLAEWQNHPVFIVEGESSNTKITTADDLILADLRMKAKQL